MKGQEGNALQIKIALTYFLAYLKKKLHGVHLVTRNSRVFDFHILSYSINKYGLDQELVKVFKAFVDSLVDIKSQHQKLSMHIQKKLAEHFSIPTYNAHNAEGDVTALDKIVVAANCNDAEVMEHSYSSDCHFKQKSCIAVKETNIRFFLHCPKIMKMCFVENIAGSGLALGLLKQFLTEIGEKH